MLLSLNELNTKRDGVHISYGSKSEDMVVLNKGDKIALKRFHYKMTESNRIMFQQALGLKRFKLFIKYYDNIRMGIKEDLFLTFVFSPESESYTFEADKDSLVFQECSFDESVITDLKIYGVVEEPNNYVPIMNNKDTIFELDWVVQRST